MEPKFVETPDGRTVAWSELGDHTGPPVIWCHGGLSGRTDASFAAGRGDRGGRPTDHDRPSRDRRVDAPEGPDRRAGGPTTSPWSPTRSVSGSSASSAGPPAVPHALACAARLPDRVLATATIGSMEPVRDRAARRALGLRIDRVLIPLARHTPWLARSVLAASARMSPDRQKRVLLRALSDADREVLEPLPAEDVVGSTIQAAAPGTAGIVDDYRAFGTPDWGFDLGQIPGPVRCWQGAEDAAVPVAIAKRVAAAIPGAALELVPDAGHFLVADHGTEVFTRLLADAGA